jgi:divalent metal cation (Fe/Co/Zn/Cd) transporter
VAGGARQGLLGSVRLAQSTRRQAVTPRVLARVLVLNLAIALVKLALGYATGAVSIVSDGFQSLTDSVEPS